MMPRRIHSDRCWSLVHGADRPARLLLGRAIKSIQGLGTGTMINSSKKKELDLEKSSEKAGESTWQCIYPNERREKNQVYALLNISKNIFEQEERSLEYVIRTGWEEAVQGWGKAAPFACLQLQKQAKKSRTNETVNSCLFCLDMRQNNDRSVSQETKSTRDQSKSDCKLSTEKKEVPVHSSESSSCTTTVDSKREGCNGKLRSTETFQGEKKSLPVKEYSAWHPEKVKTPETLKCKVVKTPEPTMPAPGIFEDSEQNSLLVLPPVKDATPKDSADSSLKKSKTVMSQSNQKMLNATSVETASGSKGTRTIDQKDEKENNCIIHDTVKEKKICEPLSFIPMFPKAFLQGGTEQLHWPCALWSDRKITTTSNSVSLRKNSHLANMQFLNAKGLQYTNHDKIRSPFTNNIKNRSLSEAKQGNESKPQAVQLLPGLFPSLTVKDRGRNVPFTCYQAQNKSKKPKTKKTVIHLPHIDIASNANKRLAQATKSTYKRSKYSCKVTAHDVGDKVSGKEEIPICCRQSFNFVPPTDGTKGEMSNGKLNATQTFQSKKNTKNLPRNQYNKKQLEKLISKSLNCKNMRLPHTSHGNLHDSLRYVTLRTLLDLFPLKETSPCLPLEPSSTKRKAISIQGNERTLNPASTETAFCIPVLKQSKKVKSDLLTA
nr:uncharacterized protein C16orf46 homolog isoform X1 [Pelodiscus sinensis]|eukprot:XP_006122734.2 uncharacterized protein C16orf46 homolog isoform X1 [Pelodiscus sinensis]